MRQGTGVRRRARGALAVAFWASVLVADLVAVRTGGGRLPWLWCPVVPIAWGATQAVFEDIEESLTCQCGCGLTVYRCNHLQCPSAIPLREEIRAQMAEGKDKEAILAYFKNKYGEKILSAPSTSGFNLIAWIMPFALVGLGGLFVGVVLMRWTRVRSAARAEAPPPPRVASPYDKILEKELKDFEG